MCCGAILLYKIARIVVGEHETFQRSETYVLSRGVELVILNDEGYIRLMNDCIATSSAL